MLSKKRPITIYWFSGTGNTLLIAERIQKTLESRGFVVHREMIKRDMTIDLQDHHDIGIVVPVAVQSTYPLVWDFIKALPQGEGRSVFLADTLEMYSGGIVGPMKVMLEAKNYKCLGAKEFRMPSSMETHPVKAKLESRSIPKRLKAVDQFVKSLIDGKTKWADTSAFSEKMKAIGDDRAIWTQTSQRITVSHEDCILCGACERQCPMQAIRIQEQVKIDHESCIACMRCGNYCPKNAFRLSGKAFVQKKTVPVSRLVKG